MLTDPENPLWNYQYLGSKDLKLALKKYRDVYGEGKEEEARNLLYPVIVDIAERDRIYLENRLEELTK